MFYSRLMQLGFGFGTNEVAAWRHKLGPVALPRARRTPIGQLVKSLISAKTYDAVSLAAYRRLGARFGSMAALSRAEPADVARVIGDVTYAETKAAQLIATLRTIGKAEGGFALDHLARRPLREALTWLERLPGVARKVSASTLNASTLARPVMIVDTHVLRVFHRLGFVGEAADYRAASEAMTAAMPGWAGDDFLGFHIALKRLGQEVCRWDVPLCEVCPLRGDCPTARGGGRAYSSTSDYVRDLIRRDEAAELRREAEVERLRALWDEGIASGEPRPFTPDIVEDIIARGRKGAAAE